MIYRYLADITVAIHFGYVAFVVVGAIATLVGAMRGWRWIRNRWFRGIHLAMILVVVLEAWVGMTCPLTTLEQDFRSAAGEQTYQGDFIANWMHEVMFFDLDPWAFTVGYTLFGALVVANLVFVPPRWRGGDQGR
ncbi:DUF2784 domain-containing protein [Stieleria mannarensis]|uniref:DUF2784 domain-containing protein n=1 Tax=Stieleria mannarensis TaxID=2755585 RepID=UPI0015FFFB99